MAKEISDEDIAIRQKLKDDFIHYAGKCLYIRAKSGKIEPLVLNQAQQYIHQRIEEQRGRTGKVRALILKARQQGASTYIGGRFYHKTSHSFGTQAFILTHALDATANLYKMAQRFHANTPQPVRPQVSTNNSKELIFGLLDSGYKIGTAENKSVGRSSTIQLFHGSEVAFWANAAEHAKGILQAVPGETGTEVILESTANGIGNYFHEMWQAAEAGLSEFIAIFVPWFWQLEYSAEILVSEDFRYTREEAELAERYSLSPEQIKWRRVKIQTLSVNGMDGEKAFKQEYPCNATEAFQLTGDNTYVPTELVMRARKEQSAERFGPLILACDPARFGDDRTSIIRRQGRVAFGLESYSKKDTMEVTGILHMIIQSEQPDKVLIDVGGLGAGIVDRLHELGYKQLVKGINAGSSALNAAKYKNKRSEMWGECREWLENTPCTIPDVDSLHADLCNIRYKYDSNTALQMESKEDMRARKVRSPDEADALCLTFALPDGALKNTEQSKVMDEILIASRKRKRLIQRAYNG